MKGGRTGGAHPGVQVSASVPLSESTVRVRPMRVDARMQGRRVSASVRVSLRPRPLIRVSFSIRVSPCTKTVYEGGPDVLPASGSIRVTPSHSESPSHSGYPSQSREPLLYYPCMSASESIRVSHASRQIGVHTGRDPCVHPSLARIPPYRCTHGPGPVCPSESPTHPAITSRSVRGRWAPSESLSCRSVPRW
jgi:hypothetical protein